MFIYIIAYAINKYKPFLHCLVLEFYLLIVYDCNKKCFTCYYLYTVYNIFIKNKKVVELYKALYFSMNKKFNKK